MTDAEYAALQQRCRAELLATQPTPVVTMIAGVEWSARRLGCADLAEFLRALAHRDARVSQ